jgi:hypothetical protein
VNPPTDQFYAVPDAYALARTRSDPDTFDAKKEVKKEVMRYLKPCGNFRKAIEREKAFVKSWDQCLEELEEAVEQWQEELDRREIFRREWDALKLR